MAQMDDASIDAVVCDPPYGLEFMGKAWDKAASPAAFAAWCTSWAVEALRVLKPGGHLLAFGGTRTFHRLTVGVEDAGFEIRDCLSWLYGSGFPKSHDVSKALDKAAGATRESVGVACGAGTTNTHALGAYAPVYAVTAPATDAAREWEGWGTALKPAWEPCVVARKPLTGTVAANVQQYGTGAVNVDGCRVGTDTVRLNTYAKRGPFGDSQNGNEYASRDAQGRWPANVVLDEAAGAMLDAQAGQRGGGFGVNTGKPRNAYGDYAGGGGETIGYGDRGGPSRFFYCAKASKRERGEGNTHPTVKPVALMRWLVRMVTPPGGVVLDPFAGSGTTLIAAREEGFRAIGLERESEYVEIIRQRVSSRLV